MLERVTDKAGILAIAEQDYRAELVAIDEARIGELSAPVGELMLMQTGLKGTVIGNRLLDVITHLLILNSMNFRFWDLKDIEGKSTFLRYGYEGAVGALGMRAAVMKAWGNAATPVNFFKAFETSGVEGIFADIPDATRRDAILRELASNAERLGRIAQYIEEQILIDGQLGVEVASYVATALPLSYGDRYLKKIQLALAEIAAHCVSDLGLPLQTNFTLFADYQLPKVLRALGVLVYSQELSQKVDTLQLIAEGSAQELAIRAATILAGEKLAQVFDCPVPALDNYLWQQRSKAGSTPFHLTPTTAY